MRTESQCRKHGDGASAEALASIDDRGAAGEEAETIANDVTDPQPDWKVTAPESAEVLALSALVR